MASILSAFKATNYKQIDDKEQRDAYLALMGQNYDAKRTMNRASSSVISAAIDAGSECFAKGNLLNQQLPLLTEQKNRVQSANLYT